MIIVYRYTSRSPHGVTASLLIVQSNTSMQKVQRKRYVNTHTHVSYATYIYYHICIYMAFSMSAAAREHIILHYYVMVFTNTTTFGILCASIRRTTTDTVCVGDVWPCEKKKEKTRSFGKTTKYLYGKKGCKKKNCSRSNICSTAVVIHTKRDRQMMLLYCDNITQERVRPNDATVGNMCDVNPRNTTHE